MDRARLARLLVPLLLVALLAPTTSLARSPSPGPAASTDASPRPAAIVDVDAFESLLTDLGIGVIRSASDLVAQPEPRPIVTVTRAQVAALAHEVADGGGLPGWDIDRLTPMPDGAPPFSYLIAAWLDTEGTPRAEAARGWYAEDTDWTRAPEQLYPRAVLTLFSADVAEHVDRESVVSAASPGPSMPPVASPTTSAGLHTVALAQSVGSAPCTFIQAFFNDQILSLFRALRLAPDFLGSGGVLRDIGGFVAGLWNAALDLAQQVVSALVRELTAPIMAAIGTAVAVVGVISQISSYITGWAIALDGPDLIAFDLAGAPTTAHELRVRETSRPFPHDDALEDCARASGVTLPRLFSVGAPVTWRILGQVPDPRTPVPYLVLPIDPAVTRVPADRRPTWRFQTATEPSADGAPREGIVLFEASLPREEVTDVVRLGQRILDQGITDLTASIPTTELRELVRGQLRQALQPVIAELEAAVRSAGRSVFEVRGVKHVVVQYHAEEPSPGPSIPIDPMAVAVRDIVACDLLADVIEMLGPPEPNWGNGTGRTGTHGAFASWGWASTCEWYARVEGDAPSFSLQLHYLGAGEDHGALWESWEPLMYSVGEVVFEGRRAWRMQAPGADGYIILARNGVIVTGVGSASVAKQLTRIALERVEAQVEPSPAPERSVAP